MVWRNDGTFTYSPPANFFGIDQMAYFSSGPAFFNLTTLLVWKWLHSLNGVDPGVSIAGFQANWRPLGSMMPPGKMAVDSWDMGPSVQELELR